VLRVNLTGVPGVPVSGVGAVSLNVIAVDPAGAGVVTVFPCGSRLMTASLNYVGGQIVANAVIAPVSADGDLCLYSLAETDVVVDLNRRSRRGRASAPSRRDAWSTHAPTRRRARWRWSSSASVVQGDPAREGRRRRRGGGVGCRYGVAERHRGEPFGGGLRQDVPVRDASGDGKPQLRAWADRANAVIAPVSGEGHVCLYSLADTDLVVDINGWFTA
jgi:hypothetical protein